MAWKNFAGYDGPGAQSTRTTANLPNYQLYNCCTDNAAPDWSRYVALTIVAMSDFDGRSEMTEPGCDPSFWCVFGVDKDDLYEPITDCTTREMAHAMGAALADISGLKLRG